MKRIFGGTLVLAALLCASLSAQGPGADDQNKALLAEIEAAWKRQEEAFKEVEIEWKEELFMPKGSQSNLWQSISESRARLMNPSGEPIPATDLRLHSSSKVRLQKSDFSMERKQAVWSVNAKQFELSVVVHFFDQKGSWLVRPTGLVDWHEYKKHPSARFGSKLICDGSQELPCRPIAMAFRPTHKAFRLFKLEEMSILSPNEMIDGVDCTKSAIYINGSRSTYIALWLAKSKNFLPIRWAHVHDGTTRLLYSVKYNQSISKNFFPSSWSVTNTDDSKRVLESFRCETVLFKDASVGSVKLDLPAKTFVHDRNNPDGKQYYIITDNGSKRYLSAEELLYPYDQLVEQLQSEKSGRLNWVYISIVTITILFFMIVVCVWFVMRRNKSSVP
jgi:hypothetical protein